MMMLIFGRSRGPRSSGRRTMWFGRRLVLVLGCALTGAMWFELHPLKGPAEQAAMTRNTTNLRPGSRPAGWYFQTRQWQADARTLLAALEYLMAPETA
jgi:hypothetical protein